MLLVRAVTIKAPPPFVVSVCLVLGSGLNDLRICSNISSSFQKLFSRFSLLLNCLQPVSDCYQIVCEHQQTIYYRNTHLSYFYLHYIRGDLSRQYQQKLSALELKRSEVMRLSQDFESKLRAKEVLYSCFADFLCLAYPKKI